MNKLYLIAGGIAFVVILFKLWIVQDRAANYDEQIFLPLRRKWLGRIAAWRMARKIKPNKYSTTKWYRKIL